METDRLRAALCAGELVRTRLDLDYRTRSLIISRVPSFDTRASSAVIAGVAAACRYAGVSSAARGYSHVRIEKARGAAQGWMDQGVFLVSRDSVVNCEADRHDLPPVLFARGPRSILEQPAVSILNSRTSRSMTSTDTWLTATKVLFGSAAKTHPTVISSYGTVPYAVVSRLACVNELPVIIVCEDVLPFMKPRPALDTFLCTYEDLFRPDRTLFLSPYPPGRLPARTTRSAERDRLVVALSSIIMAAAVREGGTMETAIRRAASRKAGITVFLPERPNRSTAGNMAIIGDRSGSRIRTVKESARTPPKELNDDTATNGLDREILSLQSWPERGSCLIHYTRACHGPWPGQTMGAYCQSLIDDSQGSAHTGFDTLIRILTVGIVRATHRLTRGNLPVVSFTECRPDELNRLIKWRRGLIRWSFEPYGIAVDKKPLLALGAKPVIYGEEKTFEDLPDDRKHLFQIRKKRGSDWSLEREWRLPGDLLLRRVPRDKITIIVDSLTEARVIQHQFGYEVTLAGIATKARKNHLRPL